MALLSLCACSRRCDIEPVLERIEAEVVYVNPDSALRALEAIDSAKLTTPRAVALHSLLLSQARHKCYVDLSDAESLASAARYFRRNGDLHHAMLAQYYRAETLYETADYANAVRSVMEAEDLAEKLDDKYYLGRIYDLLANMDYVTYNNDSVKITEVVET